MHEMPVSQSEKGRYIGHGTYLVAACTKKYANILASCALVDNVVHFLWVGMERQRGTHSGRCNGNLERVPRAASICCTVVRSSTSEDECLESWVSSEGG